jgi:multidrug resistance efflux pump
MSEMRGSKASELSAAAMLAAIVLFASCSPKGPAPAAAGQGGQSQGAGRRTATIAVQAATAAFGLLSADRDTAGIVSPVVQSQVAAQVAGIVLKVERLAGDRVKAGDVVVQLDDSQLKLALSNAQASLDNARINLAANQDSTSQASPKLRLQLQAAQSSYDSAKKYYDSQKALFDLGGISASQLDTANSQLATAQANLEGAKTALDLNGKADDQTIAQLKLTVTQAQNQFSLAQLNLQNSAIRAPFDGQIAALNVQPGMYVSLNTAAFTLVSLAKQIAFNVSPSDAPSFAVGSQASFEYGGRSYPIRIKQAPSAPINGVVPLVASMVGADLPFGTVGNISYFVPLAKGILIPLSALETQENQNYVFVIQGGKVSTKDVKVVAEAGVTTAVEGLNAGDVVVLSAPPGLISGSQVQATMIAAAGQAAPQPGQQGQAYRQRGQGGTGQGGSRQAQGTQPAGQAATP